MKIKNTIVLIAIGIFGTINTQAKSNLNQSVNQIYQVQKQDPPKKNPNPNTSSTDDNGGGIIMDPNPPIYEPPSPGNPKN